ncbi:hypothetical protein DERP_006218 [Dermatophagoides pteronyssinus]|uniref:Uncharacterized protein n=1 Tax=Dermatophagoides pteronyssinus TaxID=6956 RepID=A0ABQ8IXX8_DERPT|nr:hypothetical protein DERP_006218 [Dermatophagoides pteronyssinus]
MSNPWLLDTIDKNVEKSKHCFDDNFETINSTNNGELNENGLCLPDSQKYLHYLENRLHKLNSGPQQTDKQAKKMLKDLALKRDGLFDFIDTINSDTISITENNDSPKNPISTAITNTNLYDTMERKLFPHLHSIDPEESKKLLNHDILNSINSKQQDNQKDNDPSNENEKNEESK